MRERIGEREREKKGKKYIENIIEKRDRLQRKRNRGGREYEWVNIV